MLAEVLLGNGASRRRLAIRCAIAALLLVISVYPDVIFRDASLSAANLVNVTQGAPPRKVTIFPERPGREAYHGYYDLGGSAFQSEPGAQFMTRVLWSGQSVYWNPYSATGAYGIETLVDVKTSPLSMTVALLGGSDAVFHAAYLGFSWLGVFCLLVLLTAEFRLSLLAALVGAATYLLNGYHVANIGTNYAQTWLYFPILGLGLVSFAARPRVAAFLGITAGSVLILSTTFLPTTIVMLGTMLAVGAAAALGFSMVRQDSWQHGLASMLKIIAGQIGGVVLAVLVLAVVWLPVLEALRYMATGDYYANRTFYAASFLNFISMFTPKHAFELYNAIPGRAAVLIGNAAFHQGIVGALLAAQVLRRWPPFQRVVLGILGFLLVVGVARIYGLPGLGAVIDALPVVGHLGEQYLWAGIAILFVLVVPFGVEAVLRGGVRLWALALAAAVILGALLYTTRAYGIESAIAFRYVAVVPALIALAVLVLLNLHWPAAKPWLGLLLLLLSWGELTYYVDHVRLHRADQFSNPPPFVRFLQAQGGSPRVASYGYWGIPPEYGSAYGIRQIGSMNFHILHRYEDLFNRLILPDPTHRQSGFITLGRAPDTDSLNLPAYGLVGTDYLIVPVRYPRLRGFLERSGWTRAYEDAFFVIFANPHPLPRAFVTHALSQSSQTPLDIGRSPLDVATSDDAELIAAARRLGISDADPAAAERQDESAAITTYDNARLEIQVNLAVPGILVVNDAWHPNWSVSVDGRRDHLGAVNEAFRGVALPAGRHVVEMTYAPRTLAAAKILTVIGLLIVMALVTMRRRIDPLLLGLAAGSPLVASGPNRGRGGKGVEG